MTLSERLERELLYSTLVLVTFNDYQKEAEDLPIEEEIDVNEVAALVRPALQRDGDGWVSESPRRRVQPEAFSRIVSWAKKHHAKVDSIDLEAKLIRLTR